MDKRRGFTLIELLVVIAIIALLMGILMPALARVKKQAKSAGCKMTLHQWAYIWSMYCDDNDGYFPVAEISSGGGSLGWRRGTWVVALRSQYRTKEGILICPAAKKRRVGAGGTLLVYGGKSTTYVMGQGGTYDWREEASYGGNCWIYKPLPGQANIQGRPTKYNWKTKDVARVNEIPIFGDAMWRGGGPSEIGQGGDPPEFEDEWAGYNKEMKHFCIDRHNGFVNHLFLDWSVRQIGLKELWKLKWHREFEVNGPWTRAGGCIPSDWPEWMKGFKDY